MNNALLGVILNARSDFYPIDYQHYLLGINIRYPIRKKSESDKSEPTRCNVVNGMTISHFFGGDCKTKKSDPDSTYFFS